jgi:hypothetical protein
MLQFYKPNPSVKGHACSFWGSTTEKAIFSSFIKQDGWNTKSRTGSFTKNKNNPKGKAIIKLSVAEAGSIIDAIQTNREFSAYHDSKNQVTRISFKPYMKEGKQAGFSYGVTKDSKEDSTNKTSFIIGLNFGEATSLRIYLERNLVKIFDAMDAPAPNSNVPDHPPASPKENNKSDKSGETDDLNIDDW